MLDKFIELSKFIQTLLGFKALTTTPTKINHHLIYNSKYISFIILSKL